MKKNLLLSCLLCLVMVMLLLPATVLAVSDADNSDWSTKSVVLKNTNEAGLMVRVGDIDAFNDEQAIEGGYNPFTAKNQRSHGYPWIEDASDPAGTDRMFVGSHWTGSTRDGYSRNVKSAGALSIDMSYDTGGLAVKNALLQLCIDDFQSLNWGSNFTVTLNGKDAPFIAELLNQVDQTGPTSYIISAIIPSGFFSEIASGKLTIIIDETTGLGDGYAVDFAKLLVNYNNNLFTGEFSGRTEPGATARLLGTSTTVTTASDGSFTFKAIPGLNAVRASKSGFVEGYDFGIVLSSETMWFPEIGLISGTGSPDIDFSKFNSTDAWSNASAWATAELAVADDLGLIPGCLEGQDLAKDITRAEFAAVCVKAYEVLSGTKAIPIVNNPFTDCNDVEVLKAYNIGAVNGTSATTYDPDTLLNREQAATMLTRVFKRISMAGWTLATDSNFTLDYKKPTAFADDTQMSAWAKDSIYFMAANSIINGVGGNNFAPKNITSKEQATGYANATREQALLIAVRMVQNLGK